MENIFVELKTGEEFTHKNALRRLIFSVPFWLKIAEFDKEGKKTIHWYQRREVKRWKRYND